MPKHIVLNTEVKPEDYKDKYKNKKEELKDMKIKCDKLNESYSRLKNNDSAIKREKELIDEINRLEKEVIILI
jgi:hypothetical protein